MFDPGSILYIPDYNFGGGAEPRNKYMIVLCRPQEKQLLVTLTTSQPRVPWEVLNNRASDCITSSDLSQHCHVYDGLIAVCDNGYAFPVHTQVHFAANVFPADPDRLIQLYGQDSIELKGVLTVANQIEIVYCLFKGRSRNLKRAWHQVVEQRLSVLHQ